MKKYAVILFAITIAYVSTFFFQKEDSLLNKTIAENTRVYEECFRKTSTTMGSWEVSLTDTERYRLSTDCWRTKRKFTPDDLFLTVPKYLVDEKKCAISQGEDSHVEMRNGGMYATDLACNFKEQGVYAPDYLNDMKEYKIESTWVDKLLGNFVVIAFKDQGDIRWYFGHTVLDWWFKVGDTITTWTRFAHANISGSTTGWHTHVELRRSNDGAWQSVRYVTRFKEIALENKRMEIVPSANAGNENTYFFTHYDLWDVSQNDASPCHWASWKDLCELQKQGVSTMALTSDIRKKLDIKFGDKVVLIGQKWCEWVYQVEDEMNERFRTTPWVQRPWTSYYIKWDLPGRPGWICSVIPYAKI